MKQDTYQRHVSEVIRASVSTTPVHLTIPVGRRIATINLLTYLIAHQELVHDYLGVLSTAQSRDPALFAEFFSTIRNEFPIESVISNGISVLTDEQLARLSLDAIEISMLSEYLDEMLDTGSCGSIWYDVIANDSYPVLSLVSEPSSESEFQKASHLDPPVKIDPHLTDVKCANHNQTVLKSSLVSINICTSPLEVVTKPHSSEIVTMSSPHVSSIESTTSPLRRSTSESVRFGSKQTRFLFVVAAGVFSVAAIGFWLMREQALPSLAPQLEFAKRVNSNLGPTSIPPDLLITLPAVPVASSVAILEIVDNEPLLRTREDRECYAVRPGETLPLRKFKVTYKANTRIFIIWSERPCGTALSAGLKDGSIQAFLPENSNRLVREVMAVVAKSGNRVLRYRIDLMPRPESLLEESLP